MIWDIDNNELHIDDWVEVVRVASPNNLFGKILEIDSIYYILWIDLYGKFPASWHCKYVRKISDEEAMLRILIL